MCLFSYISFPLPVFPRLKITNNFLRKHSTSSKCLQCNLTHQSNTSHLWSTSLQGYYCGQKLENTLYLRHKSISGFFEPGASLTCSSVPLSSSLLLSNKLYFLARSPLFNEISCNNQQFPCSSEIVFNIFNVSLMNQSTQNFLFFKLF